MSGTDGYRYPGPNEFEDTPADRALFCGRDEEIHALTQQIMASRLLVLYGNSGLGKSSLLKAGVSPRLREYGFCPIRVRTTDKISVLPLLAESCEEASREFGFDYTRGVGSTAWEFFKTAMFWRGDTLLHPVLIFDQFEEIFTRVDPDWRRNFAGEIGPLASGNLPDSVRRRLERGEPGLTDLPPRVKLIFSIREEFYGSLQELSADFPALFQDRFRLLPLDRSRAELAIREPALKKSDNEVTFLTPPFTYAGDTLAAMLDFLAGHHGTVEPFQLQLLCQHIEQVIAPSKQRDGGQSPIEITPDDLGGKRAMSDLILRFYTDSLDQLPTLQRRRARELCDTGLLSSDGHRLMLQKNEILHNYRISEDTLKHLIGKRILREEPRLDSLFYEIGHDTIAQSILKTRRWRFPRKYRLPAAVVIAAILAFDVIFANHALREERDFADAYRLAALAVNDLDADPELAVLLAMRAVNTRATPQAIDSLNRSLMALHLQLNLIDNRVAGVAHDDRVTRVTFSPNGELLATGSKDTTAKVWDANTGTLLRKLKHLGAVRAVSFSHDSRRLVTASADGTVTLWNIATGEPKVLSEHEVETGAVFSPNGKIIATVGSSYEGPIRTWDATTGNPLRSWKDEGTYVLGLAFNITGEVLATADSDKKVRVWGVANGRIAHVLEGHTDAVEGVAFSPDNNFLASAGMDRTVRVWDQSGKNRYTLIAHTNTALAVAFDQWDRLASAGADGKVNLWDPSSGRELLSFSQTNPVEGIAFSPDGRRLASASWDGTVKVWNTESHKNGIMAVALSPNGTQLATADRDGTVKLWDADTQSITFGRELRTFRYHHGRIPEVAFSKDGNWLASADDDGLAIIWDVNSDNPLHVMQTKVPVNSIAFSPDEKPELLATAGDDGTVTLWNTRTGQVRSPPRDVATVLGKFSAVDSVSFSPDGKLVVTGTDEGKVILWKVASGQLQWDRTLAAHKAIVSVARFSPNGEYLVTGGLDKTVKLWSTATWKELHTFVHGNTVSEAYFSPDSTRLATASWDRTVRIWDVSHSYGQQMMFIHSSAVHSVAYSPDGKHLATASEDTTAHIYILDPKELMKVAGQRMRRLKREMTSGECHNYLSQNRCPAMP